MYPRWSQLIKIQDSYSLLVMSINFVHEAPLCMINMYICGSQEFFAHRKLKEGHTYTEKKNIKTKQIRDVLNCLNIRK